MADRKNTCVIKGCRAKVRCHGLCALHWQIYIFMVLPNNDRTESGT